MGSLESMKKEEELFKVQGRASLATGLVLYKRLS